MKKETLAERVYGPNPETLLYEWKCTSCKKIFYDENALTFSYCPNCGKPLTSKDSQEMLDKDVMDYALEHFIDPLQLKKFIRRQQYIDEAKS